MNLKIRTRNLAQIILFISVMPIMVFAQDSYDLVDGNLIQFNDNGAWCWYQDERAVVDIAGGNMIIGSDASGGGVGGSSRDGYIEGVIFNLNTRFSQRYLFMNAECDDHNTPAFLIRPDGKYLTMYAQHYDDYSRYRIFNGNSWGTEQMFDWSSIPGGTDFSTTYSNLFYLSAEDKVYNFVRCYARSPNMMVSTDQGNTWSYGGLLTEPDENIGYVNGYFKYASNDIDRIDFICTEHHPRDYNTSIYHGYIQNGKSYTSDGIVLDSLISDKNAPHPSDFTLVFAANTIVNDELMTRCWTIDIETYDNGIIAAIFQARVNDDPNNPSNDPDHVFFFARYDGSAWTATYLGQAGKKMYFSEQDYTGLGALHPDDPNTIYISTPFDPRDDTNLVVREIFKGTTDDNGTTWTWTPVTQNSVVSNFRPIVPAWDADHTVLLWWRGTYSSAQRFDAAIVGIIEQNGESLNRMHYVDANHANTMLSNGSPLITTGPDGNRGAADNLWHQRTGFGNGGSVLTSAELNGENAPMLKTTVVVSDTGAYDVWINFWANPDYDWRIKAGLSEDNMKIFRQMASKQVENGYHHSSLILVGGGNTFLYQAYLGRVNVADSDSIEVFVDDEAIETGTTSNLIGDISRTWYDGISYATLGKEPAIFLSKKILNFGTVLVDSSKADSILVHNPGSDSLRISSITSTNPHFIAIPSKLVLGPSESDYIFIVFSPKSISNEIGNIILTHNVLDSADSIHVTGEGIEPNAVQDDLVQVPITHSLKQNYPNPFNPRTVVGLQVGASRKSPVQVDLSIYNLLGQKIVTLVSKSMPAGYHEVEFNAESLSSGIYLYRIMIGEWQDVRKMVLLR
jgi:hypothetical protein